MALLITTDGKETEVKPADGNSFSLKEMQNFVGGLIEWIDLEDGRRMIIHDAGSIIPLPVNKKATAIFDRLVSYMRRESSGIHGDVVVGTRNEIPR